MLTGLVSRIVLFFWLTKREKYNEKGFCVIIPVHYDVREKEVPYG